jgi:hypothetical protein
LMKCEIKWLAVSQNMVKLYDIVDIRRDLGNFLFFDMLKMWGLPCVCYP